MIVYAAEEFLGNHVASSALGTTQFINNTITRRFYCISFPRQPVNDKPIFMQILNSYTSTGRYNVSAYVGKQCNFRFRQVAFQNDAL